MLQHQHPTYRDRKDNERKNYDSVHCEIKYFFFLLLCAFTLEGVLRTHINARMCTIKLAAVPTGF